MLKCLLLYTTLLFVLFFEVKAQELPLDTIKVREISQKQGLSQLNALSLEFDNLGYLWIATENGLNRYNGDRMKVFKTSNEPGSLLDDHIRDLYQSNDTLWLATNTNSICAYILNEDQFISFNDKLDFDKFPSLKFAYNITPINERYLLAGTINYCVLIDRKTLSFKKFSITDEMDNEYITSIVPFKKNSFLLSTNYKDCFVFDYKKQKLQPLHATQSKSVNLVLKWGKDRILFATTSGLYVYNTTDNQLKPINTPFQKGEITGLFIWYDNQVLISAANHNYLLDDSYQCREITFLGEKEKTIYTTIRSVEKDIQGGVWLGSEGRGVLYYHPKQQKFTTLRIKVDNAPKEDFISIFNFLKEKDTLWMATEFGIVRYLINQDKYKLYLTNNLDYTLAKDHSGTLWAGGFGDGLLKYNRENDSFDPVLLPITDNEVIHITPISKDSIWVHTWSDGIYSLNINDYKIKQKTINGKSLIRSRNSYIDSSGSIWLASDNGLYQIQDHKTTYYGSLSNERVFSITEDLKNNIWAGTAKGLNKINVATGEVDHFTQQEGLPNDFIYGVEADHKGNIWVSTNFGVSQFNPDTETFTNYTEQDGLQNNEFNGKASYKDDSGRLYFGGMNGFNIINVDSIPINKIPGNTVLEDIQLFGKSIQKNIVYSKELSLSHEQNVITFNYTNLNYLWPEKNLFRFKLEGFDKQWRPVTKERSSTYTNLNPGVYTFKVQGSNNELIWGDIESFKIIINSPWYQKLWFKILLTLFLVMAVSGFVMYRHWKERELNKKLSKRVKDRTYSLLESNLALQTTLEITKKQKENISYLMRELNHRVKNNLQLMTSLIDFQNVTSKSPEHRQQLKQLQSRIFTIAKIHDSLNQQDLNTEQIRLDKFIHQLALDIISFSGSTIKLETNLSSLIVPNDHLTYIGLILNELITNSIKHAFDKEHPNPQVSIFLQKTDQDVILEYSDNGKGFTDFNPHASETMGISLIQLLTEELEMDLEIKSDKGCCFRFIKKVVNSSNN